MARQATPDIFKDALATAKAIQDDVKLIMGEPGQGGAPVDVDLDLIDDNPYQPRLTYDEAALQELADSIAANGLVQPVSGRRKSDGRYELEQGHRRLRAFRLLRAKGEGEYQRIPMFVRQVADFDLAMRAWAENHDREGITAIEEAQWIQRMMTDFGLSQAEMAKRLSKSAATVANKLRLLRAPENVQALVVAGSITERQVSAMMPFYDLPEEAQGRTGRHYYNINEILRGAQTGASSDSIRKNVDALVEICTRDVEGAPWAAVDLGIDGAQSALCTKCPQRVMRSGKDRCPILACYQAKASAWNGRALAEIVAATGIPAAPDRDHMKYNEYQQFYGDDRRIAQEHGFAKPPICDRLRVRSSSEGLQAEGATDTEIICLYGADGKCGCLAKIRRELMKDGKARWKRFRTQTQEALTEALSAPTPDTLRLIAGHMASWDKRDNVASMPIEDVVRSIVDVLIKSAMPYDVEKKSDAGEKAMADLLARAFITPPWAPLDAEGINHRFDEIQAWLDDFMDPGDGLPTPESMRAILDELNQLHDASLGHFETHIAMNLSRHYQSLWPQAIALNDRIDRSYVNQPSV